MQRSIVTLTEFILVQFLIFVAVQNHSFLVLIQLSLITSFLVPVHDNNTGHHQLQQPGITTINSHHIHHRLVATFHITRAPVNVV